MAERDANAKEAIRRASEAHLKAAEEAATAAAAMWRSRLDLALEMDDDVAIKGALEQAETALWDNGNCGCGGGGTGPAAF